MKFKIFIFTFNRPDLLTLQIKCLRKFAKNLNEIYVIHDSRNNEFVDEFNKRDGDSTRDKNFIIYVHID